MSGTVKLPLLGLFPHPFWEEEKWKQQNEFAAMDGGRAALLTGFVISCTLGVPQDVRHWLKGYWEGNLFK